MRILLVAVWAWLHAQTGGMQTPSCTRIAIASFFGESSRRRRFFVEAGLVSTNDTVKLVELLCGAQLGAETKAVVRGFASKGPSMRFSSVQASRLHEVLAAVSLESSEDDVVVVYNSVAAAHEEALGNYTGSALVRARAGAPADLAPTDCSLPAVKKRDARIASLKVELLKARRITRMTEAKLDNETKKLESASRELQSLRSRVQLRRRRNVPPPPATLTSALKG